MKFRILILFILLISTVNADNDDNIDGTWEYDLDNDPPVFLTWDTTDEILPKDQGHTFFATVLDIDNTSTELIMDFVYSENEFVTENKFTMNFILENPEDTFRFEYDFPAQVQGYSIQYYYNVTDATTEVNKTLGPSTFFTAQWGQPFPTGDGNPNLVDFIPIVTKEPDRVGETARNISYLTIFINFGLLVGGGSWRIYAGRKKKSKRESGRLVRTVERKWRASPTGRFLKNIKDRDKGGSNK